MIPVPVEAPWEQETGAARNPAPNASGQEHGQWGLTAQQAPHRPGRPAPALGLRAERDGRLIVSQTGSSMEITNP
jgi:hypothetical protein